MRLIFLLLAILMLPGCTAFEALFNGSNNLGKIREDLDKFVIMESAKLDNDYPHLAPVVHARIGMIKKSRQINVEDNWLSNPNSSWGAVASLGGLVKPWLGVSGISGAGFTLLTMVIGYFRNKKIMNIKEEEHKRDQEHKDKMHKLEKREILLAHREKSTDAKELSSLSSLDTI